MDVLPPVVERRPVCPSLSTAEAETEASAPTSSIPGTGGRKGRLRPLALRTFHATVIHSHTLPICTLPFITIQSHRHQSDPRSVSGKPPFERVMLNTCNRGGVDLHVGAGKPRLTSVAITGQNQRDREGADADPAISMFPVTYQENWQHMVSLCRSQQLCIWKETAHYHCPSLLTSVHLFPDEMMNNKNRPLFRFPKS